jgi:hypothetical protein
LNEDEFNVILGALDLSNKVALKAMTPIDKVVMVSTEDKLDRYGAGGGGSADSRVVGCSWYWVTPAGCTGINSGMLAF